ncbi:MAG TPA: hypothetical protein VMH80_15700 [Bryobacteraceae bacterium]|nr:hypothetical protein [Bryobacteraceae bacterium]
MRPRRAPAAFCFLLTAYCVSASAEIIDRIAITVGNAVITESQIAEELRVTAFLNHAKLDLSLEARRQAAARLIEQALVRREMDLSRYPAPSSADAEMSLKTLQAMYPSDQQYQKALQDYGITEDALKRHLLWQLTLLRFVDFRFRSGILISDSDVQAYYKEQRSEWQKKGVHPIPSLEETRSQIEEILTQKGIDQALDRWMIDVQTQVAIRYLDESLRGEALP